MTAAKTVRARVKEVGGVIILETPDGEEVVAIVQHIMPGDAVNVVLGHCPRSGRRTGCIIGIHIDEKLREARN